MNRVPESKLRKLEMRNDVGGVSIIGYASSGKTVFTTLLVKFLEKRASITGYSATPESGLPTIMKNSEVLSSGHFPSKEEPGTIHEPVQIRLSKTGGKSVTLKLNDIQGEVVERLGSGEVSDPVAYMLTHGRKIGSAIGPLSSVIQAAGYAVAIDCSEFDAWEDKQYQYAELLRLIVKMKRGDEKTRLSNPLALLFTKCDLLPADMQNATGRDLLSSLSAVNNYIAAHFTQEKVAAIAARVEVERATDGRPVLEGGNHKPKIPLLLADKDFLPFVDWALKWL